MSKGGRPWPAVILASCIAVAACNWLDIWTARADGNRVLVLPVVPGLALVGLVDIRDRLAEVVVAVALSLALGTGVAMAMVFAKIWSPDAGLAMLIGISLIGAAIQIQLHRSRGLPP